LKAKKSRAKTKNVRVAVQAYSLLNTRTGNIADAASTARLRNNGQSFLGGKQNFKNIKIQKPL